MFRSTKFYKFLQQGFNFTSTHLDTGNRIYYYSTLYLDGGFIIFGGSDPTTRSFITRLDLSTTSWTKLGDLQTGRSGHNVIYDGEVFIVVGGKFENSQTFKTEKCTLAGSSMTCSEQSPTLNSYQYYPALVMVPEDFCTEL